MGLISLLFIIPFLCMLSTSFKYRLDVMEFPVHQLPQRWNFQNYVTVIYQNDFSLLYYEFNKVPSLTIHWVNVLLLQWHLCICETSFSVERSSYKCLSFTRRYLDRSPSSEIHYFQNLHTQTRILALIMPGLFAVFWSTSDAPVFMQIPLSNRSSISGWLQSHRRSFLKLILPLANPCLRQRFFWLSLEL